MEVASRRGPGCELHARPFALLASFATRTASPVVRGLQNCLEWPRVARRPLGVRRGLGTVAPASFFGSACVTERPARRETRRTIIPMRPSSAEGLVGTLILDSCPLEDLESRISNLESRISGYMGLVVDFHPQLFQVTS